ncbi:MAG TPA: twin-arginine translocation signal domain-containing protein [Terriglobales bacterium]|nr:twin-arginine translocation signal domain-containing protein [Terriglobales bacterium]
MNRREFLKDSAGSGAALSMPPGGSSFVCG